MSRIRQEEQAKTCSSFDSQKEVGHESQISRMGFDFVIGSIFWIHMGLAKDYHLVD